MSNVKEALEAINKNKYALLLMDLQMPEMDGLMATEQIRKAEEFSGSHLPIIAMTAYTRTEDRE